MFILSHIHVRALTLFRWPAITLPPYFHPSALVDSPYLRKYNVKTTIQRWGNSLAVRIPKLLAEETALGEGDEVTLLADEDRIVVERPQPHPLRLADLLDGVTKTNRHGAVDYGKPVGREAW